MQSAKKENNAQPVSSELIPKHISHIGTSVNLAGELVGEEDVLVEGRLKGKINLGENNLIVGRQGQVDADIVARDVTIRGRIKGNISAYGKITIEKDAQVIGDISAARVSIMDGAQFKGSVKMTSP
jgi:cytoskeletal protein CcmA (bactofilin family)